MGSIGRRHIKNLQTLGVKQIGAIDPSFRNPTSKNPSPSFGGVGFRPSLKQALKEKWDAVFICSPSSTHMKIALDVAKTKTPMFIEKPLSHTLAGLGQLQKAGQNIKPIMTGYNIDFHPQFQKIKALLAKKTLGKVWGVRAEFGQYLPDWRPKTDYSKSYSAKKALGGGILLDDIHEINSLYNLFGPVKKVFGLTAKQSNLKIETEDYVEAILQFENGIIGQVHMDYLQRDYSRHLKIIGEKGALVWDLGSAKLDLFPAAEKKWQTIDKIENFDWNTTYLAEAKEFLQCLKAKKNPSSGLQRGIETLKIALAIKKSVCLKIDN